MRHHPFDETAYRQRNFIERMFCRLKDWRRIATRYDKLSANFAAAVMLAAVVLAAVIIWWTLIESGACAQRTGSGANSGRPRACGADHVDERAQSRGEPAGCSG